MPHELCVYCSVGLTLILVARTASGKCSLGAGIELHSCSVTKVFAVLVSQLLWQARGVIFLIPAGQRPDIGVSKTKPAKGFLLKGRRAGRRLVATSSFGPARRRL